MELRDDDFQAVVAAVNAVDSLMVSMLAPRGASLRCRIELAAAVLLGAIDHGHAAAVETSAMDPEAVMGLVVDLVERRAMEIWGRAARKSPSVKIGRPHDQAGAGKGARHAQPRSSPLEPVDVRVTKIPTRFIYTRSIAE